jgi:superoxide reductase
MTAEHYIEWIEVMTAEKTYRQQLHPEQAPEATFEITEDIVTVRAYCNLHGLRKNA